MPELPDVEMYKLEAKKAVNESIEEVNIRDKSFIDAHKHQMIKYVEGNTLKDVIRQGKYIFLNTQNNKAIVMHFGMTGSLAYRNNKEKKPKYTKFIIRLGNDHCLYYMSKRKLGSLEFTHSIEGYISDKEIGTDALKISEEDFRKKFINSSAMAKNFLTDQSKVSGIGNVYADEILFQANVHPKIKSDKLDKSQIDELYKSMNKVLKKSIEVEADISKLPDSYLLPKREKGKRCPRCNGKIKKTKVSGRTGYYCPGCQKK